MRKNLISIIYALSLILFIVSPVFASRVEFDWKGKCNIEGTIKAVDFEEAYKDPCVKDNSCPIGAFVPKRSARYILSVSIDNLSCTPGEVDNPSTYESQFKINEENIISVNCILCERQKYQFKPGDKISGTVEHVAFSHTFTSYELEKAVGGTVNNSTDNQKNIEDSKRNHKNYIFIVVISVIVIGIFLIKQRQKWTKM